MGISIALSLAHAAIASARVVPLLGCEELGDKIDVTILGHLLEPFQFVQRDVLLDEVAIRWVVSLRDLLLLASGSDDTKHQTSHEPRERPF